MSWGVGETTRSRRPYHVGNLRAQLLEEARALLESGGRSELNLRGLAARAGIAAGSVYHHYASKSALMAGLAAGGFRELEAALKEAAATAPDATPIRTCALAYFGFARSQPALYDLMFDAGLISEPEVAAARDSAFAVLESAIAQARSQQDRDADTVHKVALAVWACGHGA
ncbi:TetR/AcrR family transcriptional regulator, partial [Phenylobacterium sp. Root700]|uniref:TetR/AcrR family transcriptional regulator n=2 Tax=unclassified Phenylobacterium TaxID=2640670 RepID=UPI0035158ECA